MSFNQDIHALLNVPEDQLLNPHRSTSPSMEQQLGQQSQQSSIGSFRTRARAGTLPSRLYSSSLGSVLPNTASSYSRSPQFNANPFDQSSIPFDQLSLGSGVGVPAAAAAAAAAAAPSLQMEPAGGKQRIRSGSLFGMSDSNSIWSNDSITVTPGTSSIASMQQIPQLTPSAMGQVMQMSQEPHSPIGDLISQGRLSPSKFQLMEDHTSRVRAYSTNNALLNEQPHFRLQQQQQQQQHQQQKPFGVLDQSQQSYFPQDAQLLNPITEVATQNRPRAQTFQNGVQNSMPSLYNNQQQQLPHQLSYHLHDSLKEIPESISQFHKPLTNDPLLLDHIDHRLLNWTSSYSDPSLGPTNTLLLSNLPSKSISTVSLATLLMNFGRLLTIRLFTGDESALVEFETLECAMSAKAQLHHQELMPGYSCLVAFAKIFPPQQQSQPQAQPQQPQPQQQNRPNMAPFQQIQPQIQPQQQQQQQANTQPQQQPRTVTPPHDAPPQIHIDDVFDRPVIRNTIDAEPPKLSSVIDEMLIYAGSLGVNTTSGAIPNIVKNALAYEGHDTDLGPLPDPIPIRDFDAPKLREMRKLIDGDSFPKCEVEELALAMLDELPELSSDYLGNTVVQKLFDHCDNSIKYIMLKRVSNYLAQMGAHKNGTWSAQKMISVANSPAQKNIVSESLKPYCGPLFNDQFGNYVIQCSLKFGAPWNDFIFEAILAKFTLITQNRFGARAVRACLESHEASLEQTALISSAILTYAEHLAIDQNAALLVTWFLDTCTLPNRYMLLTPRLIPHLTQLCTHKLAHLTILKILNNRSEAEAKSMILTALFGEITTLSNDSKQPPQVLEQVLQDNTNGISLVLKILLNPQLDAELRKHLVEQVRKVLSQNSFGLSYQNQNYKRLMDEVGLYAKCDSTGSSNGNRHSRSHSHGANGTTRKTSRASRSPQSSFSNGSGSVNGSGNRRSTTSNGSSHRQQQQPSAPQQSLPQHQQQQQQHVQPSNHLPPPPPQMQLNQQQQRLHVQVPISSQFNDFQQQQMYQPPSQQYQQDEMFAFDAYPRQDHPAHRHVGGNEADTYNGFQNPYGYGAAQY